MNNPFKKHMQQPMMAVYAGPEFFRTGQNGQAGVQPEPCSGCGKALALPSAGQNAYMPYTVIDGKKYCPDCAAKRMPLPTDPAEAQHARAACGGADKPSLVCPFCSSALRGVSEFCPECGQSLEKMCEVCGTAGQTGSFCRECGAPLHD